MPEQLSSHQAQDSTEAIDVLLPTRSPAPWLAQTLDGLLAQTHHQWRLVAVVHGDPKLSNLMWQDRQITAVLDWEMAINGDPLSDLAYMLYGFHSDFHPATRAQMLPGMLNRDEVIALWEKVSGRSAEGLLWHEIAQFAKLSSILAEGVTMFKTGRSTDPKLAYFQQNLDNFIGVTHAMLDAGGF